MVFRRDVLKSIGMMSAGVAVRRSLGAVSSPNIRIKEMRPRTIIPKNFIGLGYEMSSVAKEDLLTVANKPYVQLIRNLGRSGMLRVGGIVADFTTYSDKAQAIADPRNTVINRAALHRFRAFLDEVDWSALWSVNFGSGTLAQAIEEGSAVAEILGPRLHALELGNEVENYGRGTHPLRTPPYGYETYSAEFRQWRDAIKIALPAVRFAAPDTAASIEWVERTAHDAHGDVQLLTTHYYRGDQRQGTQRQLLEPDPHLLDELTRLRAASSSSGIPWRMCETNSFFGGGRPGLSDTLAGALWTLDFMMLLAAHGCAGVNIETGVNQLGFISSYSPIEDDGTSHNSAGASYYGMLAFAAATYDAPEVFEIAGIPASESLSVYALGLNGQVHSLTLINRSAESSVDFPRGIIPFRHPTALHLTGPSLDSRTDIRFGDATVQPDGRWTGKPTLVSTGDLRIAAGNAVVLRSA